MVLVVAHSLVVLAYKWWMQHCVQYVHTKECVCVCVCVRACMCEYLCECIYICAK